MREDPPITQAGGGTLGPALARLRRASVLLVSNGTADTSRYGYRSRQPAEVVAVLVNDGSARAVASVAVQEAVDRHAPVRFLQVLPLQLDDEGRTVAEEALFREALHALRGHPRIHSVFELVRGHAGGVIRSRSGSALLLVVGSDQDKSGVHSLAEQCLEAAPCAVRTVPT